MDGDSGDPQLVFASRLWYLYLVFGICISALVMGNKAPEKGSSTTSQPFPGGFESKRKGAGYGMMGLLGTLYSTYRGEGR